MRMAKYLRFTYKFWLSKILLSFAFIFSLTGFVTLAQAKISVSIYQPAAKTVFEPEVWTTISGTASSTAEIKKVIYYADGKLVCRVKESPFNCSYRTPSAAGKYTIRMVARDSAGAKAVATRKFTVSSTSEEPDVNPPDPDGLQVTPEIPGYSIYFADEFNNLYNGAPNHAFWDYDVNYQRNNEVQCYTENRRSNVRVENRSINGQSNGVLVLQARKENYPCAYANGSTFSYTSGAIMTRKKSWGQFLVDMPHGRYEIRAKVPDTGAGTWPAIWLLGSSDLGGWPKSGEIDIMEQYGSQSANGVYKFESTLHRDGRARPWPTDLGTFTGMSHSMVMNEKPGARFRVFAMEWTPTSLEFFIDGKRLTRRTIQWDAKFEEHLGFFKNQIANSSDDLGWPYGRPSSQNSKFYMILNLALQGGDRVDPAQFDRGPVEFLVDYVRVYRKN